MVKIHKCTSTSSKKISDEEIDEALIGSFPASDPPPWTLGLDQGRKPRPKQQLMPKPIERAKKKPRH